MHFLTLRTFLVATIDTMSWWSKSEVESQILKATSSSIPTGEQDLPLNLEISDSVRSKDASAKEVLQVLRKRLYDVNPNVQILCLHLLDLLAKNGGSHFLAELTSKEFIDAYIAQLLTLVNQNRNPEVVTLMLDYFQTWSLASKSRPDAVYLHEKYEELKRRRDLEFPDITGIMDISDSFLESATPPEWSDSATCMKSGQPFNFYNRKHHCRNCGGVFIQEYCGHFRPLPHFGINTPVRVCDDCEAKLERKYQLSRQATASTTNAAPSVSQTKRSISSNNSAIGSRYTHDLQEAINLSLQASKQGHVSAAAGGSSDTDAYDDELERAIQESIAEMNLKPNGNRTAQSVTPQAATQQPVVQPEPEVGPKPALPPAEKQAIEDFARSVEHATPRDAVYNPTLINLSHSGTQLQGKVIAELRTSTNKLATLEDLHGKLLTITRYYDQLLEAELNPELKMEPVQKNIESTPTAVEPAESRTESGPVSNSGYRHMPEHYPDHHGQPGHELQPSHQPDNRLYHQPSHQPGNQPEPDHQIDHQTDHQPDHQTDHQPDHQIDHQIDRQPEHQPDHLPDYQPEHQPDQPDHEHHIPEHQSDREHQLENQLQPQANPQRVPESEPEREPEPEPEPILIEL